jgi:AraC family transcriptional regulator
MKLKPGQFYGKTSKCLSADGYRFTEKSYHSDAYLPLHSHELSHFCFVLSGRYDERISADHFQRQPSALVFYPPDVSHAEKHFTNGRHLLVEIDTKRLDAVREYGASLKDPVVLGLESSLWLAARMHREFSERDAFSSLALESISTELLIAASRRLAETGERRPPKWLDRVKEYLRDNSSSPPGLNDLATAAGVHPTHLARVFRQFEGCTAGDYVRGVRIGKARNMMISTDEPLVEIALQTGFADQTHFSRTFKRATGMTPTEFRSVFRNR